MAEAAGTDLNPRCYLQYHCHCCPNNYKEDNILIIPPSLDQDGVSLQVGIGLLVQLFLLMWFGLC